jgi:hypothetical protein
LDTWTFEHNVVVSEACPVAVNVTVPVGGSPPFGTIVAVKVTASPACEGLSEDVSDELSVGFGPKMATPSKPFEAPPHEMLDAINPSPSTSPLPLKVTVACGATTKPFSAVAGPSPASVIAVA